ncbi:MAG: hypothetical protein KBF21_20710 [Thermoanaerobaculia bacterium]|nr:hypothetical protein [Thermoanaerobaculia bacterium]MBP9826662.1 hypothetical protein [Thermoanaerobaculia bacterium]
MHASKTTVSLFALAFGLTVSAFAGAAADTPAPDAAKAPQAMEKACCRHHDSADGKAGMNCDHARMQTEGEKGEACRAQHAAMHKDGVAGEGKACCAKHADCMKGDATADAKASCAHHAAMHKGGDETRCCCSGAGKACPHPAAAEAPAKS